MLDLHQQMSQLSTRIASLEERLGVIYGKFVEITVSLGPFLERYHNEILPYHRALLAAQRELVDLRALMGDRSALEPGVTSSPLDELFVQDPSVEEQFERVWKGKERLRASEVELPPPTKAVQQLYTRAVVALHPGLANVAQERRRRARLINQVNAAFVRRDETTLRMVVESAAPQTNLPALVDERTVQELRNRAFDLEELIVRIEGHDYDLRHGDIARVRAHTEQAEVEGRDFLAELNGEIRAALRRVTDELLELRTRQQDS